MLQLQLAQVSKVPVLSSDFDRDEHAHADKSFLLVLSPHASPSSSPPTAPSPAHDDDPLHCPRHSLPLPPSTPTPTSCTPRAQSARSPAPSAFLPNKTTSLPVGDTASSPSSSRACARRHCLPGRIRANPQVSICAARCHLVGTLVFGPPCAGQSRQRSCTDSTGVLGLVPWTYKREDIAGLCCKAAKQLSSLAGMCLLSTYYWRRRPHHWAYRDIFGRGRGLCAISWELPMA